MQAAVQDVEPTNRSVIARAVEGNAEFAFDLYQRLRGQEGNLFFSPYSISTALAMTYAGARGDTEAQMASALRFASGQVDVHSAFSALEAVMRAIEAKGAVTLAVANSLWPHLRYPLLESFVALVEQYYRVTVTGLDYDRTEEARAAINTWVKEQTAHKITGLIPAGLLDALTTLVLVNAIYFKGNWAWPCDPAYTKQAPFRLARQRQVSAPMMFQTGYFGCGESEGVQILDLPFAGDDLSMIVLLSAEVDGLAHLEDRLTVESLGRWLGRTWEAQVQIGLPRFRITFPCRLDPALESIGMVDAFTGAADFSGMSDTRMGISAVLSKAYIAVDEQGAEAAAATAVVLARSIPIFFNADHPFVFMIRETSTGSILFVGRVVDPTVE